MKRTRTTGAALLVCALPLLLTGCLEDIIRSMVHIPSVDGEVFVTDWGVDVDGLEPDKLTLLGVQPDHGPFIGGTKVVITGAGFGKGTSVRFGGRAVQPNQLTLLSPMFLEVVTPAGEVGPADVSVSRGKQTVRLQGAFTYNAVYLDPDSGPTAGSTLVTIHGKDTAFAAGMTLTLGGAPMTELQVLSATSARAKTPAGSTGPAALVLRAPGGARETHAAVYTYYDAANPRNGGLGGGAIQGSLTVTVLDMQTRVAVAGAQVVLAKERALNRSAQTDLKGTAVFSRKGLRGPVSVTVGKAGYETTSVVSFDARELTVLLLPIPNPQPGPVGPGAVPGYIQGHLVFGGPTGMGTPAWKLVPEPKEGQVKRAYVYTTTRYLSWGPPALGAGDTGEGTDDGATAWPFTLYSWTGAMAVYAIAGLYNKGTGAFDPYAMGITRGVAVGPGESVQVDVHVQIPLTEQVTVRLDAPPAGVNRHQVTLAIDLGADGLIMRPDLLASGDGIVQELPFGRLPRFNYKGLTDASYTVEVRLDAAPAGLPLVMATEQLTQPTGGVLAVRAFVGPPLQLQPPPGGTLQGNTLSWGVTGASPNLAISRLKRSDGTPVWRVIGPGTAAVIRLPDPATSGLPAWPAGQMGWTQYLAYLPAFSFDQFTYAHTSSSYWSRWSTDAFSFKVP